ncbi:hypothetical protein NE237_024637 [Protea cynaroides]|uniref:Acid phosphatase n=1 Tax=Protea cynaroides TaxID=273540 RepID=A0A9Q0JZD7_9MAGN|nr:hypothetical protein NE237_024637 [Protea cynaroides]
MDCAGRLSLNFLLSVLVLGLITSTVSSQSILQIPGNRKIIKDDVVWCESWKFTVETNDAGVWESVPEKCGEFVKDYVTGDRYPSDSEAVAEKSLSYATEKVKLAGDGKDAWVFDIDETLLSHLPYYALHGYGTEAFDETSFDEWVYMAAAPALPASLKLYNSLLKLGFKLVLLTGRSESQRNVTVENLLKVGYKDWERLILRGPSDSGTLAVVYKSERRKELQLGGYRIHGCSGDQWSDLMGDPMAKRLFKLPNPMFREISSSRTEKDLLILLSSHALLIELLDRFSFWQN